jgi:hypothetical protein
MTILDLGFVQVFSHSIQMHQGYIHDRVLQKDCHTQKIHGVMYFLTFSRFKILIICSILRWSFKECLHMMRKS